MGARLSMTEIQQVLAEARKHLPDTTDFPADDTWDFAWNELSGEAQESVKKVRQRIGILQYKLESV